MMGSGLLSNAQTNKLDRLKRELALAADNSSRKELILAICEQNHSLAADSLLKFILAGEKIIQAGSDPDYSCRLLTYRVNYLIKTGDFDAAIHLADSLAGVRSFSGRENRNNILVQKCRAMIRNNQSGEAIEIAFGLLQGAETQKDTGMAIQSYVLLGWAHMEIEKYEEAIKWLEKGCRYTLNTAYFLMHPSLFNNIASSYNNVGKAELAMKYVNLALDYSKKAENLTIYANALNIRADIYIKRKDHAAAQKDLEEALHTRELLMDPYYVLSDMGQLAYFYASEGRFDKGIEIAKKGIEIAESGRQYQKLLYLYSALAENYKKSGQEGMLAETLSRVIALKDTIYQNNSEKAIADLEGKYEYQKNQNTIIQQNYALSKSRYILIGSIVLLLLSVILFILIYKNYQHVQRRKLESLLNEQQRLSDEAILTAGEKERKRIAADLHDNLGAHAAAISSNVKYLKEGIFNRNELIMNLDENANGMVNHLNDTIWVLKSERLRLTNLSDRFKLWLQRLLVNYPGIRYHFNERIDENIELSPNKILHLFMLLKESVNNAIRHSQCKDLTIHFLSGDYWEIVIEDNGKGFSDLSAGNGNGLQNMKQRASECGWAIAWEVNQPSGTRVILREEGR